MIRKILVVCAVATLLLATAWRGFDSFRRQPPTLAKTTSLTEERSPSASMARHAHRPFEPAPPANFYAEFLNLLAEFETSDDDPFVREKRASAFQARLDTISQSEIAIAFDAAASLYSANPTEAAMDLRDRVVQRWTELDPLTTPQNTKVPTRIDESLPTEIISLSDTDPTAAARLAIEQLDQNQQQSNILLGIVQRWAAQDYDSAASWVAQFPEGELRQRALIQLARSNRATQTTP
jgi:hypothetical protein